MKPIALLLLLATSAFAEVQKTPPPPAPARAIAFPKITERKLDNGLTVVLVPLHNVPKVTAILTFMSGTRGAVAQVAGRVITEGTVTRSSREIREALRAIGGSIASESVPDATRIETTALSEFTTRMLDILADVARHPAFPKEEVALARTNLANEIAEERSTPEFVLDERMRKAIYGTHPYAFTTAEPEALEKVTREELRAYAAAHYVPNDAHLIVTGDLDVEQTFAAVRKAFGEWTKVALTAETVAAPPKRDRRQLLFVDRPGSVQSLVRIAALAPPRRSADYIPLRIASTILGGAFYSRINRNIREAKGYSYAPYSEANLQRRAGTFFAEAAVRNEVTGATILELLYELDRMRIAPVTDEELSSAKTYTIGGTEVELETQAGLANRVWTIYTYDLSRDFLEAFRANVEKVTAADVKRVAAKYFDTYRGAVVIVGDWSKVRDQVEPFGDVTVVK